MIAADPKGPLTRGIRGEDPPLGIKQQQRLADGVDDCLGVNANGEEVAKGQS